VNPEDQTLPKDLQFQELNKRFCFSPEKSASSSSCPHSLYGVSATFWQRRPVVDVFSGYCPNQAGSRMQAYPKTQAQKSGRENHLVRFDQKLT
jgi:hypothetical protein